jgi:ribose transport system permease protein
MSTENATTTGFGAETGDRGRRFLSSLLGTGTIFVLLLILWIWITILNPTFAEPGPFLAYLKRSAPLVILAAGAYFVLVSGNFDLSVGSLVTVMVVVAARLIDGDPSNTWPVIVLLLVIGVVVGFVNGFVSTVLRVPSFITTLGMLLILNGAVFLWTGGAPRGALADNFRSIGRQGIDGIPWIEQLPWSVILLFVIGAWTACGSWPSCFRACWPPSRAFCSQASAGSRPRSAEASSSTRSPPACWVGSCSVAAVDRSWPRWPAPSPSRRCSRG